MILQRTFRALGGCVFDTVFFACWEGVIGSDVFARWEGVLLAAHCSRVGRTWFWQRNVRALGVGVFGNVLFRRRGGLALAAQC